MPPKKKATSTERDAPIFTPTPEAKSTATRNRIVALVLWALAIGLELFAIFWVMRPPFDELAANQGFATWRWWLLIAVIVVMGALAIVGSQLWKKANHLDPASRKEPFRFFVQNQLGAIIAIIAFLPLVIVIFTNKDMSAQQRNVAGIVGVVVGLAAVLLGIDFTPLSQEQAAVESQVVTELTGQDQVWWSAGGEVMHLCAEASDLQNVTTEVSHGTTADAFAAGKEGITLEIESELTQCGYPVPDNIDEIVDWVRAARGEGPAQPEPATT